MRILIVSSSAELRGAIKDALTASWPTTDAGFDADSMIAMADSYETAVAKLGQHEFDAIVVHTATPRMQGGEPDAKLQAAEWITELMERCGNARIFGIGSAYARHIMVQRGCAFGSHRPAKISRQVLALCA